MFAKLRTRTAAGLVLVACIFAGTSCSNFPADPEGTLDRVTGGTLRVGVSHSPPFTDVSGAEPAGPETDLARDFAASLDAGIEWAEGGEEHLMEALKQGDLDLVIGGLTESTPWTDKAAVTRPYAESTDDWGKPRKHVLAAPLGENAFLSALEEFLADREPGR
ncbi:transporter substrate-binding domain-containing protein [Arthrobacter sp. APC 3897]|uniref:transporter substrate-binding domain-containing protein n=1 Tax=Arthrobacter sp. APC 3897 TaxID=3035204 RepID=UPI0025B5E7C2|nr:transporter substrate-binding domain-containing protein [Arthrobacter sp. APC 3897]MDN3481789.1 transporter substrate-binding domain-containing protein [Arthrobacter sp. APC 3897]